MEAGEEQALRDRLKVLEQQVKELEQKMVQGFRDIRRGIAEDFTLMQLNFHNQKI